MTDYSELVKALRCCIPKPPEKCVGCTYNIGNNECAVRRMMLDAAAAIEDLQKRIVSALTALHLANEKMGYYGIQPYTEADGEDMISDWVKTLVHEELKQQLPKRGEWIVKGANRIDCSVCGHSICFASVLSKGSLTGYNYCPRCGAKMEVQE